MNKLPIYPRDCNEARHLYTGDCCDHGSRCPCHVHIPSQLFVDHSAHVFEYLQHEYAKSREYAFPDDGYEDCEPREKLTVTEPDWQGE